MVGINFAAEQAHGLAVHRHAPRQNKLLAGTAGSHTGIGKKFLKANRQNAECGTRNAEKQMCARRFFIPRSALQNPR
jgi:hypothetical protein